VLVTPAALGFAHGRRTAERREALGLDVVELPANRITGLRGATERRDPSAPTRARRSRPPAPRTRSGSSTSGSLGEAIRFFGERDDVQRRFTTTYDGVGELARLPPRRAHAGPVQRQRGVRRHALRGRRRAGGRPPCARCARWPGPATRSA